MTQKLIFAWLERFSEHVRRRPNIIILFLSKISLRMVPQTSFSRRTILKYVFLSRIPQVECSPLALASLLKSSESSSIGCFYRCWKILKQEKSKIITSKVLRWWSGLPKSGRGYPMTVSVIVFASALSRHRWLSLIRKVTPRSDSGWNRNWNKVAFFFLAVQLILSHIRREIRRVPKRSIWKAKRPTLRVFLMPTCRQLPKPTMVMNSRSIALLNKTSCWRLLVLNTDDTVKCIHRLGALCMLYKPTFARSSQKRLVKPEFSTISCFIDSCPRQLYVVIKWIWSALSPEHIFNEDLLYYDKHSSVSMSSRSERTSKWSR